MMKKTRVVLADYHRAYRELLARELARAGPPEEGRDCYEVVGLAGTGLEALAKCIKHRPDVLVLSLLLPDYSGVEVLRRLRTDAPTVRTLVFTGLAEPGLICAARYWEPDGFVSKTDPFSKVLEALRLVSEGSHYVAPSIKDLFSSCKQETEEHEGEGGVQALEVALTDRQRDVLHLLIEGKASKMVAVDLGISERTVEKHRTLLMRKLGVPNAASLAISAVSRGLVPARREGTLG